MKVVTRFFCASQASSQRLGQFRLRSHRYALEAAAFGHLCVAEMRIELGADEIVVVPEDRIALFGAPLVVAEDDHGDARPFLAADRAHLVHGNAERAVTGEADARRIRIADLGADDRRETVAARPEQAGRQVFAALLEGRIGIADGAVVADVAGDDRVLRQARLDRAPGLPRRHAVGVRACARLRSRWCPDRRPRDPCWRASAATSTWSCGSAPCAPRGRHCRLTARAAPRMLWATSLASPQMPTVTGLVRPMRSALMSTWMILAFFGQ